MTDDSSSKPLMVRHVIDGKPVGAPFFVDSLDDLPVPASTAISLTFCVEANPDYLPGSVAPPIKPRPQ